MEADGYTDVRETLCIYKKSCRFIIETVTELYNVSHSLPNLAFLYRYIFQLTCMNSHLPYTNSHEQQPYCVDTLSQMTEKLAERCVRQETGWLAGGPCSVSQQLGAL